MSVDYFKKYFNEKGFDFPQLLNDDFFQPVRVLFNEKHYVSASKLLLVAIDSVSFIEYGEIKENSFIKWLNTYSEINRLGITAEELWEHRNALLHMSSLTSRKIKQGKVRPLVAYIGALSSTDKPANEKLGCYELYDLIQVFANACEKWLATYLNNYDKKVAFIDRYDLIASDARLFETLHGNS